MFFRLLALILIAFGGGITVGGAITAFLTILKIVPRLVQITETWKRINLYQNIIIVSFIGSIIIYFSNFNLSLPKFVVAPIGLVYGIFIGLLSSSLAEVLNVIPVLSKKIKIKDNLKYTVWALLGGKVVGALIFWLFLK
ncbi:stage V sporulation protein AB [Tissierella pigra]|uniref:Stage V sporulation protein AB n=1 Tax=Tissierella pigra TaxID=2607614 RepID=A0A6N7Y1A5_9FIRM|nr:stage V sporulation protein AB [Tissierella pigra]MBU5427063.1 stage V sporulation protein AB [Tissierella pigra]MSU01780.1 stage V sporulation protein AB [Tissierella pigra]